MSTLYTTKNRLFALSVAIFFCNTLISIEEEQYLPKFDEVLTTDPESEVTGLRIAKAHEIPNNLKFKSPYHPDFVDKRTTFKKITDFFTGTTPDHIVKFDAHVEDIRAARRNHNKQLIESMRKNNPENTLLFTDEAQFGKLSPEDLTPEKLRTYNMPVETGMKDLAKVLTSPEQVTAVIDALAKTKKLSRIQIKKYPEDPTSTLTQDKPNADLNTGRLLRTQDHLFFNDKTMSLDDQANSTIALLNNITPELLSKFSLSDISEDLVNKVKQRLKKRLSNALQHPVEPEEMKVINKFLTQNEIRAASPR